MTKRRDLSPALLAWVKSAEWRALSRAQARKNLAAWKAAPRCGAHARSTGEPCQKPAKTGSTRCRIHGAATPKGFGKGTGWHIPTPAITAPKTERKIRDRIRAAEKKARRLAKMSSEELDAHKRWQITHKPGSAEARERARAERKQNAELRDMMAEPRPAPTGQAADIESQLKALRAELQQRRKDDDKPIGAFA
ncbi:hypothetical protein [Mesorhizobium sp.]|uniref:hypothetical protein n=1 Tax=Mesorhizobium sp. TaxID=1871066 RepID=UPI000FE774DD|nr:hypothetical protein [Mesorhizobium sp.]RWB87423.1 MAG: hypothetical protein EOQ51_10515 [Mesorhizobium sp.]